MQLIINKKLAQSIWDKNLNNINNLTQPEENPIESDKEEFTDAPTINNEDILNNYLLDDVENRIPQKEIQAPEHESIQDPFLLGVTPEVEQIAYNNAKQLLVDGMDNKELISFTYITRSGKNIGVRVVEPHYTFIANTGNEILVCFDRSINDIRAFIVGNILNNGVRYKNVRFSVRPQIMR